MVKSVFPQSLTLRSSYLLWVVSTAVLVSFVIIMEISKFSDPHVAMLLGMGLGISTSPMMMTGIKNLRSRRRVSKILKELAEMQKQQEPDKNDIS